MLTLVNSVRSIEWVSADRLHESSYKGSRKCFSLPLSFFFLFISERARFRAAAAAVVWAICDGQLLAGQVQLGLCDAAC